MTSSIPFFKRRLVLILFGLVAVLAGAVVFLSNPKNSLSDAIRGTQSLLIQNYGRSFDVGTVVDTVESGRSAYARCEGENTVGKAFLQVNGYLMDAAWQCVDFKLYAIEGKELREIFKQSSSSGPNAPPFAVPEAIKSKGEEAWQAFLNKNGYAVVEKK